MGFFLLFLLLVRLYWPGGMEVLRQILFPGASQTTFSAFDTFREDLQSGQTFGQAMENYCRQILAEAGLIDA